LREVAPGAAWGSFALDLGSEIGSWVPDPQGIVAKRKADAHLPKTT